jgi:hypothetical protein
MPAIKKFTIGIRPAAKLFRVASLSGELIDAVLAARKDKRFGDDYFKEVGFSENRDTVNLKNDDGTNSLTVSLQDVVFAKHVYTSPLPRVNAEKTLEEFAHLWQVVQSVLRIGEVRRIGVVAEFRVYDVPGPSKQLIEKLTRLDTPNHPARFRLHYEKRMATQESVAPDIEKDDFENLIYDYYESTQDNDSKEPNAFNANIDFQRYYQPAISGGQVARETERHVQRFKDHLKQFEHSLEDDGKRK